MNYKNLKFKIALVTILIYELAMIVFKLDGISIFKLILTALIWISFGIALIDFFEKFTKLRRRIPRYAFNLVMLLIYWNILNIFRSVFFDVGELTTIFGNVYTSLALLVPFVIIFSINKVNINVIQVYFKTVLRLAAIVFVILFIFNAGTFSVKQILILSLLLQPVIFMITVLPYQGKKDKVLILFCVALLFYMSILYSNRTMMLRELMLLVGLTAVYFYYKFHFKWILRFSFLLLLLPFILLKISVDSGESVIQKYFSQSSDSELTTDTRTFLYTELFADLIENNRLIIGKGANGRYYSSYFSTEEGDAPVRLGMEVGVLTMLLKGGLIAVILNLIILFIAIYFAFFKSNNYYVIGIGYILFVHTLLLFIDNRIGYTSDNFVIWFFIGVCLSKEMRYMNNSQIIRLFRKKRI